MIVQNKKILASTSAFFISVVCAVAQSETPAPPQPSFGTHSPPPGLPIDNGLIILFAIALIYGVYRILKTSKKITSQV